MAHPVEDQVKTDRQTDGRTLAIALRCVVKMQFHWTDTVTDTDTALGTRLSCNFVNVYTIAYRVLYTCRVQYTCTRVHARMPNGHPRDNPRTEVGEDVGVGVGVRVGAVECQLKATVDNSGDEEVCINVSCVRASVCHSQVRAYSELRMR